MTPVKKDRRICFNCTSPTLKRGPLCRECLRMAIITSAIGGVSTETAHRIFKILDEPWVQGLTALLGF